MIIPRKSFGRLRFCLLVCATLFAIPFSSAEKRSTAVKVIREETRGVDDAVDNLYRDANGRLSEQGAIFLKQHFVPHTEPCKRVSEIGGWMWKCTYKSGLTVYNCFRKCRGTIETARLFLGLNENKDCDSYTMVNGQRKSVCYPTQIAAIINNHGPVIKVERLNECRE